MLSGAQVDPFDRLYECATLVMRHPDYPGKQQLEELILEEIEELFRAGQLDESQRLALRAALGRAA